MTEQALEVPSVGSPLPRRESSPRVRGGPRRCYAWALITLAILLAGIAFVVLTGMRPAYDAYGWLVWGRQAAHLSLNTDAAPSWKPLPFLFTLPYGALLGGAAPWLWMVTAVASGFAAPVLAARIAFRLAGEHPGRLDTRWVAAGFAFAGVLGIGGYFHFLLIATADPMMTALCLGAVDAALLRRPSLAWTLLVLVCLGRPEAAPLVLAYAVWAWRAHPELRRALGVGVAALPALWFGVPAITSHSWLIAGKVLGDSTQALPGNKVLGVLDGFTSLYELPMQLAALVGLAVAVAVGERAWRLIAGAAAAWLIVEVALALHGWGIAPRYMFEPAALVIVLTAAATGRLLGGWASSPSSVRLATAVGLLALVVGLAPGMRLRARLLHNGIGLAHTWTRVITRLHDVIAKESGARRLLACGTPVTAISFQSILAWELGVNVSDVGYQPSTSVRSGAPIVLFNQQQAGWFVAAVHSPVCRGLRTTTAMS